MGIVAVSAGKICWRLEIAAQLRANVDELETFIGRVEDAHTIGEI